VPLRVLERFDRATDRFVLRLMVLELQVQIRRARIGIGKALSQSRYHRSVKY
jgi:hypothetical protein